MRLEEEGRRHPIDKTRSLDSTHEHQLIRATTFLNDRAQWNHVLDVGWVRRETVRLPDQRQVVEVVVEVVVECWMHSMWLGLNKEESRGQESGPMN